MDKRFTILDARGNWHEAAVNAARARGYDAHRITHGVYAPDGGLGFIRPHAAPKILLQNHADYAFMADRLTMVQDKDQVELYDDKSAQFWRWGHMMPPTWRITNMDEAIKFIRSRPRGNTLVSKADVGASSRNVRILKDWPEQQQHVKAIFTRGIEVDHCAGGGREGKDAKSKQKDYVLFQEFIPHNVTWRVNIVGRARAIFKRFNHKDVPVAQTGNVEPVMALGDEASRVLAFADLVFAEIKTKWCALDILLGPDGKLYLLETSLAWPWPSPGDCMAAPFFGDTKRVWSEIWDLMLDEYEAGVWATPSG